MKKLFRNIIKIMKTIPCQRCNGRGYFDLKNGDDTEDCKVCDGEGMIYYDED